MTPFPSDRTMFDVAFDTHALRATVDRARELGAIGGRLGRPRALGARTFLLPLHPERRSGSHRPFDLFLSFEPGTPGLAIATGRLPDVPSVGPVLAFLSWLETHLRSYVIRTLDLLRPDRILEIGLEGLRRDGRRESLSIVAELMGKHGNLFALDADRVVIATLFPLLSASRPLGLGRAYTPFANRPFLPGPTPDGAASSTETDRAPARSMIDSPVDAVALPFAGLSQALARRVVEARLDRRAAPACAEPSDASTEALLARLRALRAYFDGDAPPPPFAPVAPCLVRRSPGAHSEFFSFHPLGVPEESLQPFETLEDAFATWSSTRFSAERARVASDRIRRLRARREQLARDIERAGALAPERERLIRLGQALLARKAEILPGQTRFRLEAPEGGGALEIDLDPKFGPIRNANRLFKDAHRIAGRLARLDLDRGRLEGIDREIVSLDRAEPAPGASEKGSTRERPSPRNPDASRAAGSPGSRARRGAGKGGRPIEAAAPSGVEILRTPGGFTLFVGKNAAGNDLVTLRLARPFDYWFHAEGLRGAHVVLRRDRTREVPVLDLEHAARIAAERSEGGGSARVKVRWCERKQVRKPPGAPAGLVLLGRTETLVVDLGSGGR